MDLMKISAAVIVAIIALLAYLIVSPFYSCVHGSAKINDCRSNIVHISLCLRIYHADNGHLPKSEKLLAAIRPYFARISGGELADSLKCPTDDTSSRYSYEMNPALSGVNLSTIPADKQKSIPMLREKKFPDSHGWVIFADGHPRSNVSYASIRSKWGKQKLNL